MKICNYCGTGMDNRAHKCPFCGQDMTVRGAIKYEDNLPFNGSLDVYSTKRLEQQAHCQRDRVFSEVSVVSRPNLK